MTGKPKNYCTRAISEGRGIRGLRLRSPHSHGCNAKTAESAFFASGLHTLTGAIVWFHNRRWSDFSLETVSSEDGAIVWFHNRRWSSGWHKTLWFSMTFPSFYGVRKLWMSYKPVPSPVCSLTAWMMTIHLVFSPGYEYLTTFNTHLSFCLPSSSPHRCKCSSFPICSPGYPGTGTVKYHYPKLLEVLKIMVTCISKKTLEIISHFLKHIEVFSLLWTHKTHFIGPSNMPLWTPISPIIHHGILCQKWQPSDNFWYTMLPNLEREGQV